MGLGEEDRFINNNKKTFELALEEDLKRTIYAGGAGRGEAWMQGVGEAPGGISYEVTAPILHCSGHRGSNISSKEFILYRIILDFCLLKYSLLTITCVVSSSASNTDVWKM